MGEKIYRSAVDAWLIIALLLAPAFPIIWGITELGKSPATAWLCIGTGVFIGGLIAVMAIPCHYTLGPAGLKIRCGLAEEEIPLKRIKGAEPSRNPLSAPALSLRRVKVQLDDDSYRLISPESREEFIARLLELIKPQ